MRPRHRGQRPSYPSTRTPSASGTIAIACASGTHARTASAAASVPSSRTQTSTLGPAPESVTPRHGSAPSRSRSLPSSGASDGPIRLVHAIRERARQQLERPGGEQVDEQRRALQAVDGVRARDLGPQRLARLLRAQGVDRHDQHEPEARGRLDPARERGFAAERDREAAEDRGGHVVGVALHLDGQRQQRVDVDRPDP